MKSTHIIAALLFAGAISMSAQGLVDFINPLQGTAPGHGGTFPDITMPRGVHSWSPRTSLRGEGEKYGYDKDKIIGFDLTHQCSTEFLDYCSFSFMPQCGGLCLDETKWGERFSHSNEIAKPHYYKVVFDNGISTEIAPTERCASLRFSYPSKLDSFLILDGGTDESSFKINPEEKEITAFIKNMPWFVGEDNPAKNGMGMYVVISFDTKFEDWGIWENKFNTPSLGWKEADGRRFCAYLKFPKGSNVNVKVAASFISEEQARVNFDREIAGDRNLEETKARGARMWNDVLGKMKIEGGTQEQKMTFYSCLYRANLFPRMSYDIAVNRRPYHFSPYDGKVHEGYMFTDCGLFNARGSQMPLYCLIDPVRQGEYAASVISSWEQGGWLPSWSSPGESGMLIGNAAMSVLADAWIKGIRTFDPEEALKAYVHETTFKSNRLDGCGRPDWEDYFLLGYVADREGVACSVSKTLEYSFDDWCAWRLASQRGERLAQVMFGKQMDNWKNVFDSGSKLMRGRCPDGRWLEPFDPFHKEGFFSFESRSFCEGNAWDWSWNVQHDIRALIEKMGGNESFCERLDAFFNNYSHDCEAAWHAPYLYSYAGKVWKSQSQVRKMMDELYSSRPDGYPGDEDQGAMSSWMVMSAAGLYCVTPGSGEYVLGSPLFQKMTISLENGKTFTVEAVGNSKENVYIQSASLNGETLDRNYIKHEEIMGGGVLRLVMGNNPNTSRVLSEAPYSLSPSK